MRSYDILETSEGYGANESVLFLWKRSTVVGKSPRKFDRIRDSSPAGLPDFPVVLDCLFHEELRDIGWRLRANPSSELNILRHLMFNPTLLQNALRWLRKVPLDPRNLPARIRGKKESQVSQAKEPLLLTETQAANLLGFAPKTLQSWRSTGRVKLPFVRISKGCVRYRRCDILEFLESQLRISTSDDAERGLVLRRPRKKKADDTESEESDGS